jgi:hypothetical protein
MSLELTIASKRDRLRGPNQRLAKKAPWPHHYVTITDCADDGHAHQLALGKHPTQEALQLDF